LKAAVPAVIARWSPVLEVTVNGFYVQQMKTRWGSCNHCAGTIRLNTELAKKPKGCLEYVVVHEMAHLLEPTHNARFIALMERFMPNWRLYGGIISISCQFATKSGDTNVALFLLDPRPIIVEEVAFFSPSVAAHEFSQVHFVRRMPESWHEAL
jgi:hypothetical protein